MTDDTEFTIDVGTDTLEELKDLPEADKPLETALAIGSDLPPGAVSLASGSIVLLWAVRSLSQGKLRSIPKAIAGAGLLRYGLRKRRSSEPATFEPDVLDEESGETSDDAHKAATRGMPDPDEQPRDDSASDAETAETADDAGKIEFTHDEAGDRAEPRSKPDIDAETEDPRRETDDESVEIDISESALADEASEATGPSPEQAQPSQTDATEPEETPDEDASEMAVEPEDGADESDSTRAENNGDDETADGDDADAADGDDSDAADGDEADEDDR